MATRSGKIAVMKAEKWQLTLVISCTALLLLCRLAGFAQEKTRKDIPSAPLPSAVVQAKKAFLLNGQTSSQYLTKNGNALAFDTLYADMRTWGKFDLVDSPANADIVIELQYRPYSAGSRSFGVYNPSSDTVQTHAVDRFGADFALVVYDARSKDQLWTVTDPPGAARTVKNQQKEVIKSIDRLVDRIKAGLAP